MSAAGPVQVELKGRVESQKSARSRVWVVVILGLILGAGVTGYFWPTHARAIARRLADPIVLARVEAFAEPIRFAAQESKLDPNLLAALVYAESSGWPHAVSKADALGLTQLLPDAANDSARRLGLEPPTREALLGDPLLNLRLGASHFAWTLKNESGYMPRALVAYNAGRTQLRRWLREYDSFEDWYREQKRAGDSGALAYAEKVIAYTEVFRERGNITPRPRPQE